MKGNKFLNKDVKKYFRYGSDIVYVMQDNTVIVRKKNGESVILNNDDSLQLLDHQGQLKSKDDFRFKVSYNFHNKDDIYTTIYDKDTSK